MGALAVRRGASMLAICAIIGVCAACGGMTRAVKVLPDTLDRLCEESRPDSRSNECG